MKATFCWQRMMMGSRCLLGEVGGAISRFQLSWLLATIAYALTFRPVFPERFDVRGRPRYCKSRDSHVQFCVHFLGSANFMSRACDILR
jgi:hypothetical protein